MYTCSDCSFEFVHPLPSSQEIEAFYNKTRVVGDLKQIIKKHIHDFDAGAQQPKRDWFEKVLSTAKKHTSKDKLEILEIGSGYGYFIHYANNSGHHAKGTEVTAEYADAGNAAINGTISYVPDGNYDSVMPDKQADMVYMEHVFEHVLEPQKVLDQIKPKLNKKGIFFLSVPNSRSFLARVMGSKWPWACPPDHLYYYNKKALTAFLERNNFEVLEAYANDYYFRSVYQMYSLLPYTNFIRKKLGKKTKEYPYSYPRTLGDVLTLLPYWCLFPILKLMGSSSGNELTIVARLKTPSVK